jgi:hypothetical protein
MEKRGRIATNRSADLRVRDGSDPRDHRDFPVNFGLRRFESFQPSHAGQLFWRVGRLCGKAPIFRALLATARCLAPNNSNFRAEKRDTRPAVSVREFAISVFAARGGSETHLFYTETGFDNGALLILGVRRNCAGRPESTGQTQLLQPRCDARRSSARAKRPSAVFGHGGNFCAGLAVGRGNIVGSSFVARRVLREQLGILHRQLLAIVRRDEVCRRLMTMPGVGRWSHSGVLLRRQIA